MVAAATVGYGLWTYGGWFKTGEKVSLGKALFGEVKTPINKGSGHQSTANYRSKRMSYMLIMNSTYYTIHHKPCEVQLDMQV